VAQGEGPEFKPRYCKIIIIMIIIIIIIIIICQAPVAHTRSPWEAEIARITVQGQPRQIINKT
jgi:amino acid permease